MTLSAGNRIGRYEVLGPLGAGGMGEVYRAWDTELEREVAIKVLPEEVAQNRDRLARFEREAKAVAKLSHPNILDIHDYGREGEITYSVTELLEGETLRERLEGGTLGWRKATEIGAAIADGLAAAHEAGIVHRDLKPSNVFLTADGRVKVLDFGLARQDSLDGEESGSEAPTLSRHTDPGTVLGTVGYMSPEQVRGEPADHRSDIFSLGCVLYEMFSGRRAFSRDTAVEAMNAILKEPVPELAISSSDISPELERIVARCLEKNPRERYQSSSDLSFALRSLLTAGERAPPAPQPAADERPSIAVLPFENFSADPEQEYFCDGMAEEIINALTQVEELCVVARTSAFAFKGKHMDIREVGRRLGVKSVLEGSVRKAGQRLRITAQLVNVADGYHIWSHRFDREPEDVFAVQDEISAAVVGKLEVALIKDPRRPLVKRYTENLEAYNLYLKGGFFSRWKTEEGYRDALQCFDSALELDPAYAPAYAGKAHCYSWLVLLGHLAGGEGYPKARQAVERALELDASLGGAHANLGMIRFRCDWEMVESERHLQRAMALSPTSADVQTDYTEFLMLTGRFEEAITTARRLIELDPLTVSNYGLSGAVSYYAGRYDESIELDKRALEIDPDWVWAHMYLAYNFTMKNMPVEALFHADKAMSIGPSGGNPVMLSNMAWVYANSGQRERAEELLDQLLEMSREDAFDPIGVAQVYCALGETDSVFEWLEKAYDRRSGLVTWLKAYSGTFFKSMSSDPRYRDLLQRIGFKP